MVKLLNTFKIVLLAAVLLSMVGCATHQSTVAFPQINESAPPVSRAW